jgi:hypothetical protein
VDLVERLTGAGWEARMGLHDVSLTHPYIETATHVAEKLAELGIDPERVAVEEWTEDEEEAGLS